jgi:hypothetical protein
LLMLLALFIYLLVQYSTLGIAGDWWGTVAIGCQRAWKLWSLPSGDLPLAIFLAFPK